MEEIINSVMQSPENTNPNVLRSQLSKISGGSGDGGDKLELNLEVFATTVGGLGRCNITNEYDFEILSEHLEKGSIEINLARNESYDLFEMTDLVEYTDLFLETVGGNGKNVKVYTFSRFGKSTASFSISPVAKYFREDFVFSVNKNQNTIMIYHRIDLLNADNLGPMYGVDIGSANTDLLGTFTAIFLMPYMPFCQKTNEVNVKYRQFQDYYRTHYLRIHFYGKINGVRKDIHCKLYPSSELGGSNSIDPENYFVGYCDELKKKITARFPLKEEWTDDDWPALTVVVENHYELPAYDPVADEGKVFKIVNGVPSWVAE